MFCPDLKTQNQKALAVAPPRPQVLSMKKELNPVELDFLLRFPFKAGVVSPVDFLQHQSWGGIKVGPRTPYRTLPTSAGDACTPLRVEARMSAAHRQSCTCGACNIFGLH